MPNTAIHQSRRLMVAIYSPVSLRPGDGERWVAQ